MEISIKERQEILEEYKIGDRIRKHNYVLFNLTEISDGVEIKYNSPTDVITYINFKVKTNELIINNKPFHINKLPVVITQEEAYDLDLHWMQILSKPITLGTSREWEHIREETREPKIDLKTKENARKILFKYQNEFPNDNYEIYYCSVCSKIHLGKNKINLEIPENRHIFGW